MRETVDCLPRCCLKLASGSGARQCTLELVETPGGYYHRCQHYRFRAGKHAIPAPTCFPAFQLECPAFFLFRIDRAMHLFASVCVCCLFGN